MVRKTCTGRLAPPGAEFASSLRTPPLAAARSPVQLLPRVSTATTRATDLSEAVSSPIGAFSFLLSSFLPALSPKRLARDPFLAFSDRADPSPPGMPPFLKLPRYHSFSNNRMPSITGSRVCVFQTLQSFRPRDRAIKFVRADRRAFSRGRRSNRSVRSVPRRSCRRIRCNLTIANLRGG